ncbi:outer membrane beta-barrel protein [Geomonas sp. RF6]|uniref:outer membrane beta-barrel protein n=1 Tax=Geomonas sp. RF6 TaxID=2897342 RepID=UPI001E50CFED|nr:outer membrane beta-barrel protein [Geomonas sp. RF6]UFS68818.1 outer membrane beta-barrel protein [Geomonas sp. RF6]
MLNLHSCCKGAVSLALALPPLFLGADEASCAFLGDVLKPFASVSETYDSNVFRVEDSGQLAALLGDDQMSDFSTIFTIGTALRYTVSHQSFEAMLKRDFIRFSHYTQEDADRDEVSGKANLSLLQKWTLKLDGGYTSAPEPRTEYTNPQQNIRTTYRYGFLAGYQLPIGLTLEAGYRRREVAYSLETYNVSEYDADIYTGTITWQISPTAQTYGTYEHDERTFREGTFVDGETLKRDNTGDSFRIGFNKTVSPRTSVSTYLGYLSRRHDDFPERDFSGVIAALEGSYGLTYKTRLLIGGERQIYEETYTDWIYSVTNTFSLGVNYQVTEKVKATALERLMWKDYEALPESSAPNRSDFINETSAGVEWAPINRLTLNLDYTYSSRDSDIEGFDFTDHTVTASVAYRY